MAEKTRLDHLAEASPQQIVEEMTRRRLAGLRDCSDQELRDELAKRNVEVWHDSDTPPRLVEK